MIRVSILREVIQVIDRLSVIDRFYVFSSVDLNNVDRLSLVPFVVARLENGDVRYPSSNCGNDVSASVISGCSEVFSVVSRALTRSIWVCLSLKCTSEIA